MGGTEAENLAIGVVKGSGSRSDTIFVWDLFNVVSVLLRFNTVLII
jgi:hypothetical protein